jgi:two-component sensor histidine kinase
VPVQLNHVVLLVVSELVTNAARQSDGAVRITLETTGRELLVEVFDSGHRMPVLSESAELDSTSGRGLRLIDTLCESWGVREELNGKTVWARLRW